MIREPALDGQHEVQVLRGVRTGPVDAAHTGLAVDYALLSLERIPRGGVNLLDEDDSARVEG